MQKWFFWFNTTQIGSVSGSYRWRGRNSTTDRELNPKTLVSGLDDFPRAAYPTDDERHIDLRCWIQFAAEVMVQLSEYLQYDSDRQTFSNFVNFLSDENLLNLLHWSSKTESFADYGLHTDDLVLVSVKDRHSDNMVSKRKVTGQQPILQLVDRTFGYLNLFPFFLNQIDVTSPKLAVILNQISDRKHLWTDFGLRYAYYFLFKNYFLSEKLVFFFKKYKGHCRYHRHCTRNIILQLTRHIGAEIFG